jgi:saccharopine dehydrogenase (NAD+, L-lysine-forming)
MNILVIGAGGVGTSMAAIAESRNFFRSFTLADVSLEAAQRAIEKLTDAQRFNAVQLDARSESHIVALIKECGADFVVNACDPRLNEPIFNACFTAGVQYMDMAMNLSTPHAIDPYNQVGEILGHKQFSAHEAWIDKGLLALVGMGVEPGLSDVFARYATDNLFDTIDEIGVRDGANLAIEGYDFAPTFSIWTTIEECLNPPLIWEKGRGVFTTDCFSESEIFHFPEGIGPIECVNVEHEEVLLIPREIECNRVTFKYGLGNEFINWLKTFAYLGLDSATKIKVGDVHVAPRDVLAALLPNPAELGHLMKGKTCAGTWIKGTHNGLPREVYLYHVVDNEETMTKWGCQAVLWQTAVCPIVALELLATGQWAHSGVRGPEAFAAEPYLELLSAYGSPHGMVEMGEGKWPAPIQTGAPGWSR